MAGSPSGALHNVVTNTWDKDFDQLNLPSKGNVFQKMWLHGHFIKIGDNVAIRHDGESLAPWFAKIIRFFRFDEESI